MDGPGSNGRPLPVRRRADNGHIGHAAASTRPCGGYARRSRLDDERADHHGRRAQARPRPPPERVVLRRASLLVAAAALAAPVPAHAATLGLQDDAAFAQAGAAGTAAFLARADTLRADWVRVMVTDGRWPTQADEYVR